MDSKLTNQVYTTPVLSLGESCRKMGVKITNEQNATQLGKMCHTVETAVCKGTPNVRRGKLVDVSELRAWTGVFCVVG